MAETSEFGPRKTIFILAIVAGCFAVLWPRIFYPMITSSVISHPAPSDGSACCDVIFESDVNVVDIMQEMCQNIVTHHQVDPRVRDALRTTKLTPQSISLCHEEVLARCGIDLSSFLAERERLGKSYKQVLEEIRSFNSSLCLKLNFGVPLSQLGTPHLIRYHILMPHSIIKQERRTPPHAGGLHPAMRERGRAIPSSHIVPKITDRPDHIAVPKMRPPMGGAGHVVPPPKGNGTMGIIMPLYTLGIVLFFLYTIVKVLRKNADSDVPNDYPVGTAETEFRKMVFSPETLTSAVTGTLYRQKKERSPSLPRPAPTLEELKAQAAGDIEIDQLRQRLVETEAAMERIVAQMGNLSRSVTHSPSPQPEAKETLAYSQLEINSDKEIENIDDSSPTVKVVGMEMTASCKDGQKWSRPSTPMVSAVQSHSEQDKIPPKPIYLEGALPSQCELLVTDSETQAEESNVDVQAPIVLSGKMTLSLISLDQISSNPGSDDQVKENGVDATTCENNKQDGKEGEIGGAGEAKVTANNVQVNGIEGVRGKAITREEVEEAEEVDEYEAYRAEEEDSEGEDEDEEQEVEVEEEEVEVEEDEVEEEEVEEEEVEEEEEEDEDVEEQDGVKKNEKMRK
ncbi:claspin isoform X1 [Neodiprion virginianus]|uniref:claspin isoform X1 n=1 Tax=Neodiprion virginianus TaxID=2961670 RepID=UPI001EE6B138|nr:claspin isoform X1 [Neodiprion virginianus]XP_046628820.1 claspin isoform X1 [Neodiprion virginianus]